MNFDSPHVRWSPFLYAALMLLAMVAFWPGYLAVPKLKPKWLDALSCGNRHFEACSTRCATVGHPKS